MCRRNVGLIPRLLDEPGTKAAGQQAGAREQTGLRDVRLTLVGVLDLWDIVGLGELLGLFTLTSGDGLYDDFRMGFGGAEQG